MIINPRFEVSDEQRSALAILLAGKPVKRLATRAEFSEFLQGCLTALPDMQTHMDAPASYAETDQEMRNSGQSLRDCTDKRMNRYDHGDGENRGARLMRLVERARREDREALAGKSDSFVIGWCKVKYRNELGGVA